MKPDILGRVRLPMTAQCQGESQPGAPSMLEWHHFRLKHMFGGEALDLTPGSSSSRRCLKYASDGILSEETAPPPEGLHLYAVAVHHGM